MYWIIEATLYKINAMCMLLCRILNAAYTPTLGKMAYNAIQVTYRINPYRIKCLSPISDTNSLYKIAHCVYAKIYARDV